MLRKKICAKDNLHCQMPLIKYTKKMKHTDYLSLDGEQFLKEYDETPDNRKSFFEYIVCAEATKPYGDYDCMVDEKPGDEAVGAIHKENIKKITEKYPGSEIACASNHREWRVGGVLKYKVSFHYIINGYVSNIITTKAVFAELKESDEHWDLNCYNKRQLFRIGSSHKTARHLEAPELMNFKEDLSKHLVQWLTGEEIQCDLVDEQEQVQARQVQDNQARNGQREEHTTLPLKHMKKILSGIDAKDCESHEQWLEVCFLVKNTCAEDESEECRKLLVNFCKPMKKFKVKEINALWYKSDTSPYHKGIPTWAKLIERCGNKKDLKLLPQKAKPEGTVFDNEDEVMREIRSRLRGRLFESNGEKWIRTEADGLWVCGKNVCKERLRDYIGQQDIYITSGDK